MFLYNTLARKKQELKPLKAPEVKMYVCGPTVYNLLHVGNFRGPVVCNLLRHWLEYRNYKVTYALNFTDVDDKIIQKAIEEGISPTEVSEKYIREYKADFKALGLTPHELNPKVTESMDDIIELVKKLIDAGQAYVVAGDVMYSVRKFNDYGKLSGRKIDDLQSGARVDVDEKKQDPLDFALWKAAKPGEPAWPSPWGPGRPGWHIECSAMICKHLGEQIDIHGGGSDLMFPHHENEIAQSEGVTEKQLAQIWFHWSMINFAGQKMSKSLGNFTTMRDFLAQHEAEVYKWLVLSVHYRHVADVGEDAIQRALSGLAKVYSALALAENLIQEGEQVKMQGQADAQWSKVLQESWLKIETALDDDLNTPEVFAEVFQVVRLFNSQVKRGQKVSTALFEKARLFKEFIHRLGKILSLFEKPASEFLIRLDDRLLEMKQLDRKQIQVLVDERWQARVNKNFSESDRLRNKLTEMGISVSDLPSGSFWEVTK